MQSLKLNDLRKAYDINNDEELNLLYWGYLFNHQHNVNDLFEQNLAKETSIFLSTDFNADINTVVASLIYRAAKKYNYDDNYIKDMFNEDIMYKVKLLKLFSNNITSTENDKLWMIKSMLVDVKIPIIKLVERVATLHNISDNEESKNDLLNDTLEFYVPLAQLLGIYKIKNNLEDLCFRYDENYEETSSIVNKATERYNEIIKYVNDAFAKTNFNFKNDIQFKINKKSNYDIYLKSKKMSENVGVFHNDSDFNISGFCSVKCLTKTKTECYSMLSFIHEFGYQFGSFCDYISNFQGDEYQALHTNVFINSNLIDFRICTKEMDNINIYGVTYDWKNNPDLQVKLVNHYDFYHELVEVVGKYSNAEILNRFQNDIIEKRVDLSDYNPDEKQKILK